MYSEYYITNPQFSGRGGLEVCGNGPGPAVPLDLHPGLRCRHRYHHLQRPLSLRYHQAYRCAYFQGGKEKNGPAQNGARGAVGDSRFSRRRRLNLR